MTQQPLSLFNRDKIIWGVNIKHPIGKGKVKHVSLCTNLKGQDNHPHCTPTSKRNKKKTTFACKDALQLVQEIAASIHTRLSIVSLPYDFIIV